MRIPYKHPAWVYNFFVLSLQKYIILATLHIIPTTLVLYFSCVLLSSKGHQKQGLIKIEFDKNLAGRGLPQNIPDTTIPQDIPDTVSQIGSKVTGLGNLIPSQINSAIASVETVVNQDLQSIFPKGFSVGTTSACIVEESDTKCQNFPIELSDLPDIFLKILPFSPPLKSLVDSLTNKPSLELILILGLTFNITSTITYTLLCWFPKLRYISVGLSLISFILLAIFTGFMQEIINFVANLGQIGTVQRGDTYYGLCGSVPHALISIISMFFKPNPFRMLAEA